MSLRHSRGSAAGNIITLLLLVGIIGLGAWLWLGKKEESKPASETQSTSAPAKADSGIAKPEGDAPVPIEPVTGTPTLEAANTFVPKDNVLRIDISEYAGYGGLIVANGGLEPIADSFFAKEYGFKVAISILSPRRARWASCSMTTRSSPATRTSTSSQAEVAGSMVAWDGRRRPTR